MAKIEEGGDDFMLRVMDVVVDAQHRQLQKFDPKKVKGMVSKLHAVKEERSTALALRESQKEQYDAIYQEITSYIATVSSNALWELPEEMRLMIEDAERKIRRAREEAIARAAAEEQIAPEPE